MNHHAEAFIRAVTERLLAYALGRGLEYYDACAVDAICRRVQKQGGSADALIAAVVESVPFQMQR